MCALCVCYRSGFIHQDVLVRWRSVLSDSFKMHNGTRQGILLSPYSFARYVRSLLQTVHNTRL